MILSLVRNSGGGHERNEHDIITSRASPNIGFLKVSYIVSLRPSATGPKEASLRLHLQESLNSDISYIYSLKRVVLRKYFT